MAKQTLQAVDEADSIVLLVDARQGLTGQDKLIADKLRRARAPVCVAVNKAEGMPSDVAAAEFFDYGLGTPIAISAAHGQGIHDLVQAALRHLPSEQETQEPEAKHPKIAVVGRPNVGKSTLLNSILGEQRVIVFDQPGTTRDSIYVDFSRVGRRYTLIDTAGIRRRGKVFEAIEKFSVVKTLQAVEDANVVVLVLDAAEEISEQDAHIGSFILETGRALVVAVNKWDRLDAYQRESIKAQVARKLGFLSFAHFHHVSAKSGTGVASVLRSIDAAYAAAMAKLSTPKLTKVLIAATTEHKPPQHGPFSRACNMRIKAAPPAVAVVHGNRCIKCPRPIALSRNRFQRI